MRIRDEVDPRPSLLLSQTIAVLSRMLSCLRFSLPAFSSLVFLTTALITSYPASKTFINFLDKAPNSSPGFEDSLPSGPSLHFWSHPLALSFVYCVLTKSNCLLFSAQAPVPVALLILEIVLLSYLFVCLFVLGAGGTPCGLQDLSFPTRD